MFSVDRFREKASLKSCKNPASKYCTPTAAGHGCARRRCWNAVGADVAHATALPGETHEATGVALCYIM